MELNSAVTANGRDGVVEILEQAGREKAARVDCTTAFACNPKGMVLEPGLHPSPERAALKISKPHQAGATVSSISGSCSSSRSFSKAVASFSGKRNSTGSKYLVGIR